MEHRILRIALDSPLDFCLDYRWSWDATKQIAPQIGQLALAPFGRREVVGVIIDIVEQSDIAPDKLKAVLAVRTQLAPLGADWLALSRFAAEYYQRPLGEVMIPALPKYLRSARTTFLDKALHKLAQPKASAAALADTVCAIPQAETPNIQTDSPTLNIEQQNAVDAITQAQGFSPILLYGITGSGKTEVYLQAAARILAQPHAEPAQILILVPEINLTPQLEQKIRARFPTLHCASLHSGLAEGERLTNWLAAHAGHAQLILGTRLALFASLPNLQLIIVDEEHDPSYKQQEGLRYSARDLAIWRARQRAIPVVLGSATPALETWQRAQTGHYRQLALRMRAVHNAHLPVVRLLDIQRDKTMHEKTTQGLSAALLRAIAQRLDCGEQSLLFLNRRGYAPVVACDQCGWVSHCTQCSAFMVFHKLDRRLRCHHCSNEQRIPAACPTCGNVDIQPLGRGTQRIEETVQQQFPQARLLRIDADSTRRKGSAQRAFDSVHRGEVDILIGTQMVAKGHDFQNLTLVGILNPDSALFSHDYRASERLFAQLMQVAGRAGRTAQKSSGNASEVLIQTAYPQHPLYAALIAHDYDQFANNLLEERRQAELPPFLHQALLRAEATTLALALEFLQQAAQALTHVGVILHNPIPMALMRVANRERAQLLVESTSRPALQAFLKQWLPLLRALKTRAKWSLEVDPIDI